MCSSCPVDARLMCRAACTGITSGIAEATPELGAKREGARSCQRPSLSIQNIGASAQKRHATLRTK
jgi:hypothetical protein